MRFIIGTLYLSLLVLQSCTQEALQPTITLDAGRWYQLNYTSGSIAPLWDGNKYTTASSGKEYRLKQYQAWYPLFPGETMRIDSIRMYDKEGDFTATPLRLYTIDSKWQRRLLATFTGERFYQWTGPDPGNPDKLQLDIPADDIRYLVLDMYADAFPGEIELYGNYKKQVRAQKQRLPSAPLAQMMGINTFPWDLMQEQNPSQTDSNKLSGIKHFTAIRQYLDWEQLEAVKGQYTFSPLARGGWYLDTAYAWCQQNSIAVLPCIQNIPPWLMATYPDHLKAVDNYPVPYGSDLSKPQSYTAPAKLAFQFAARYGNNKILDTTLVSVYDIPAWPHQRVNQKRTSLGFIHYVECGNEVDKWWKGDKGYLSAREYAANLSAFYDGHKGSLGPGAGIKNADPRMQVVMAGTALASTDYFRGIVDWCREFRGYKRDGSVNLCFDVINYHLYANDAGNSQEGGAKKGQAPELSNCTTVARHFITAAANYAPGVPVWITEAGYDLHPGSVQRAIPIGNKDAAQTQADWVLRTALLYAREGVQRCFFYQLYDFDIIKPERFSSSGLIQANNQQPKPAAMFLEQTARLFGKYRFKRTLSQEPLVDLYENDKKQLYVLLLPDEAGRTAVYTLNLPHTKKALLYKPNANGRDMLVQEVRVVAGKLLVTVEETPLFVAPE